MVGLFPVVSLILVAVVAPMSATDDQFVYLFECADPKLKKDHPFIHCEDLVDEDDRDFLNEKNACGAKSDNEDDWYCWEDDYEPRDLYHSIAGTKRKSFAANCWYLDDSWLNPDCNYMRCTKKSSQVTYDCGRVENPISADDVAAEDPMGNYVDYYCFKTACQRDRYCLATKTCEIRGSINNDMWCVMKQEKVLSNGRSFSIRKDDRIKEQYGDEGCKFDVKGLPICSWFC